jgi:hypothetical protein
MIGASFSQALKRAETAWHMIWLSALQRRQHTITRRQASRHQNSLFFAPGLSHGRVSLLANRFEAQLSSISVQI